MKRILAPLCIIMAVLIVVISMTTVSFSWFAPKEKTGNSLMFSETTAVRSQDCTAKSYLGTIDSKTNIISYNNAFSAKKTLDVGYNYFRTVITNNAEYGTNVSLYLGNITAGTDTKYMLAVTVPTNTCREFTTTQTDLHIVRNAYISAYNVEKLGTGELVVDWFVKVDSGTVEIDPNDIYFTYN